MGLVTINFHYMEENRMNILLNISLCVSQKKVSPIDFEQHESVKIMSLIFAWIISSNY